MNVPKPDTETLLRQIELGDQSAVQLLLDRHRPRLKRMVSARMDPRLSVRADPSDVVQEALLAAHGRLAEYVQHRTIAFYPWLRQIAWQRLLDLQRKHIGAAQRTVAREVRTPVCLSDDSAMTLVSNFADTNSGPLQGVAKRELQQRVRHALESLVDHDREVPLLRIRGADVRSGSRRIVGYFRGRRKDTAGSSIATPS